MNENALRAFRFWETIDKVVTRKKVTGERRQSLYPSEASVVATDPETGYKEVLGGCIRKTWYRLMGFPQSNPATLKSLHTFAFGDYVESYIRDLAKRAGVFDNASVKFWDKGSGVSGELDLTLDLSNNKNVIKYLSKDESSPYIITEVKSTWGGKINMHGEESGSAKHLFDHHEGRGRNKVFVRAEPKESNLLQLVVYLYVYKDDPNLLGGKLVYMLRDNLNHTEFDVILVKEGDKHRVRVNGETILSFYVEDIYDRYKQIAQKVNSDVIELRNGTKTEDLIPPDRDYILRYTLEEAEKLHDIGKISATKLKNARANKPVGDWQCTYCSYKNLCWNLNNNQ